MNDRGKPNQGPYETTPETYAGSPQPKGPVFPGKPYLQPEGPAPYGYLSPGSNLAVQRSLMEIFDEFTEVISGELKSMNLEEYRQYQNPQPPTNRTPNPYPNPAPHHEDPDYDGPGRPSLR